MLLLLLLLLMILDKQRSTSLEFRLTRSFKNHRYHCDKSSSSSSSSSSVSSALTMQQTASSILSSSPSSTSFHLGYITDVEGNLEYFKSFVRKSKVLDLVPKDDDDDDTTIELTLREGGDDCYFIYGGDAVDKGPGDIRLCRALVQLKQRYPDRVFLLVGNRDLNKLRFAAELSPADILNRSIDEIPPPHWDPTAPTLRQYLESIVIQKKEESKCSSSDTTITVEQLNTRVNRLHYMLLHTLGCPETFEFRRKELSILNGGCTPATSPDSTAITDDQVVQSFLDEVQQGGSLLEYLEHAQVAAVIGNTLFVHGAVDVNTMKFVPSNDSKFENPKSKPAPGKLCHNLHDWVKELNDCLKHGLDDYKKRPYWDGSRTTRGGESLLALQNRPAMWGRSIISNCYGDGGCITTSHAIDILTDPIRVQEETVNPLVFENVSSDPMDDTVASWLLEHGIQRVIVGHKPTGDCPAVLSACYTGVEIVSADTSFSDTDAVDNRGKAVAVVEIVGRSSIDNHLELCGTFSDGTKYHSQFPRLHQQHADSIDAANTPVDDDEDEGGDANLGTQLQNGWWIKARTKDDYHLCRGQGRRLKYKTIPIQDLSRYQS